MDEERYGNEDDCRSLRLLVDGRGYTLILLHAGGLLHRRMALLLEMHFDGGIGGLVEEASTASNEAPMTSSSVRYG